MARRESKNVLEYIWHHVRKAFTSRQISGNLIGEDYFGNKYYEIPPQPQIGKRQPQRWFIPSGKREDDFDKEITGEWESWLRHRRLYLVEFI